MHPALLTVCRTTSSGLPRRSFRPVLGAVRSAHERFFEQDIHTLWLCTRQTYEVIHNQLNPYCYGTDI